MKEQLLDIIRHANGVGQIEPLLVTGTKESTLFEGMDEMKTVVVKAELKSPLPELEGVFGMRHLSLLQGLLNHAPYKADGAKIKVEHKENVPQEINLFNDKGKDKAVYRFMSGQHVPTPVKLKANNWDISFVPTDSKIQEFASLVNLYASVEPFFSLSTSEGNLIVHFGDPNGANHSASMTLAEGVKGEMKTPMFWPALQVLTALKVGKGENLKIDVMAAGALRITMESSQAKYDVIFPARRK